MVCGTNCNLISGHVLLKCKCVTAMSSDNGIMQCQILHQSGRQMCGNVLLLPGTKRYSVTSFAVYLKEHVLLFDAAAISAVYEALAVPAGLNGGADPMEQLLLASLMGNRIGKTYTNPALHLPERMGERIEPTQLLAYRYASPEQGPKSGNREVHFLHRSVPTHQPQTISLENFIKEVPFLHGSVPTCPSATCAHEKEMSGHRWDSCSPNEVVQTFSLCTCTSFAWR